MLQFLYLGFEMVFGMGWLMWWVGVVGWVEFCGLSFGLGFCGLGGFGWVGLVSWVFAF